MADPLLDDPPLDRAGQALLAQIKLDPFYGKTYEILGSVEAVLNAGFVCDSERATRPPLPKAGADWLMTPVHKICERLINPAVTRPGQKLVVLLMTGSFCPIHTGHVESMEIAKKALEARGFAVLGGYFSPSHDRYVLDKCDKSASSAKLDARHRLHLCNLTVSESDWLMADGWEALGVDRMVNFSEVILRLKEYLAKHVQSSQAIEVFYLFSSDHARFSHAFLGRGGCVCTLRPDYKEPFEQYAADPLVKANPNIIFVNQERKVASSSQVVRGQLELMESKARETYRKWLGRQKGELQKADRRASYSVRNEEGWELTPWLHGRFEKMLQEQAAAFRVQLRVCLVTAHLLAKVPDQTYQVGVRMPYLSEQRRRAQVSMQGDVVISMDCCIEGNYNLAISRRFPISSAAVKAIIAERPNHPSLPTQVKRIPAGRYTLFDDDIATGGTMKYVRNILPDWVKIDRQLALTMLGRNDCDDSLLDILDSRDFLVGSLEGGLVVTMPDGSLARVPYCLPYCSPSDRASIPLSSELEFSRNIWELNESFFSQVSPPILLREADPAFQRIMRYLGFDFDAPMSSICRWHAKQLDLTIARTTVP